MIGRAVDVALVLCVSGLVAAFAGPSLRAVAAAGDLIEVASRIDRRVPIEPGRVQRLLPVLERHLQAPCDERVDRAVLKVALRDLNGRNAATDYEGWSASLQRATSLLRRVLACSPLDGRRWADYALVERARVSDPAPIAAYARFSERTSPTDMDIVRRRLELWRTAPPPLRALIGDVAERDLRRVLRWGYGSDVRTILAMVRQASGDRIDAVIRSLPASRQETVAEMKRELDAKRAPTAPRVYELPVRPPR